MSRLSPRRQRGFGALPAFAGPARPETRCPLRYKHRRPDPKTRKGVRYVSLG